MKSVYLQKGFKAYFHEDEAFFLSQLSSPWGPNPQPRVGRSPEGWEELLRLKGKKVSCRCSLTGQFSLILKRPVQKGGHFLPSQTTASPPLIELVFAQNHVFREPSDVLCSVIRDHKIYRKRTTSNYLPETS